MKGRKMTKENKTKKKKVKDPKQTRAYYPVLSEKEHIKFISGIQDFIDYANERKNELRLAVKKGCYMGYKMKFFNKTQKEVFGLDGGPLHDPVTIVSLLKDDVVKFERMDVDININPIDVRYAETKCTPNKHSNIQVATEINVEKYWNLIEEGLRRY